MKKSLGIYCLILTILIGCSSESKVNSFSAGNFESESALPSILRPDAASDDVNQGKEKYLAYIHNVQLQMQAEKINDAFTTITTTCSTETEYQCTVLASSLNTGEYAYSSVR